MNYETTFGKNCCTICGIYHSLWHFYRLHIKQLFKVSGLESTKIESANKIIINDSSADEDFSPIKGPSRKRTNILSLQDKGRREVKENVESELFSYNIFDLLSPEKMSTEDLRDEPTLTQDDFQASDNEDRCPTHESSMNTSNMNMNISNVSETIAADNNDQIVTIVTSLSQDGNNYVLTMSFSHSHYVTLLETAFDTLRNKYITIDNWSLSVEVKKTIMSAMMKGLSGNKRSCKLTFNGNELTVTGSSKQYVNDQRAPQWLITEFILKQLGIESTKHHSFINGKKKLK